MTEASETERRTRQKPTRIRLLDGWRAFSILAILIGRWIPVGPSSWKLNEALFASGMATFFCLSGFLITHFLLRGQLLRTFLIKRVARIVPLAWGAMLILALVNKADAQTIFANLGFYANLAPSQLMDGGQHLWAICLEMQFYALVALLVAIGGRKALYVLPALCVTVTFLRLIDHDVMSIVTWHRMDEILAGSCLAIFWNDEGLRDRVPAIHERLSPWLLVALFLASLPQAGYFFYLRPYLAALTIGTSLLAFPSAMRVIWKSAGARYLAEISYALYVWQGVLGATALGGSGVNSAAKFVLAIPLLTCTWLISHFSTRNYEKYFMNIAKRALPEKEEPARQPG